MKPYDFEIEMDKLETFLLEGLVALGYAPSQEEIEDVADLFIDFAVETFDLDLTYIDEGDED